MYMESHLCKWSLICVHGVSFVYICVHGVSFVYMESHLCIWSLMCVMIIQCHFNVSSFSL